MTFTGEAQAVAAPDPLYGLRVHAWVMIMRGKRDVPETFFIEPTLGEAVDVTSTDYLGIECVWNSTNYWVNMQDCSQVCPGVGML